MLAFNRPDAWGRSVDELDKTLYCHRPTTCPHDLINATLYNIPTVRLTFSNDWTVSASPECRSHVWFLSCICIHEITLYLVWFNTSTRRSRPWSSVLLRLTSCSAVEYDSVIWFCYPLYFQEIEVVESGQRRFTKRLSGCLSYSECLKRTNLRQINKLLVVYWQVMRQSNIVRKIVSAAGTGSISTIWRSDMDFTSLGMARGYAYAKIEYASVRTVRIFRKIEYAYDMFLTQTWIHLEP